MPWKYHSVSHLVEREVGCTEIYHVGGVGRTFDAFGGVSKRLRGLSPRPRVLTIEIDAMKAVEKTLEETFS